MTQIQDIPGPICGRCQQHMVWINEQIVDGKTVEIFHCESCDKLAAAIASANGQPSEVAARI
jgi:protein-arginine kinase activator protein McsA